MVKRSKVWALAVLVAMAMGAIWGVAFATVPSSTSSVSYTCSGSGTEFAVPFRFLDSSHLVVTTTLANQATTLATGVDYSVTGAGGASGAVTLVAASRCPSGHTLKIVRTLPLTQPTALPSSGPFSPKTHENAFDRLTMISQQLERGQADAINAATVAQAQVAAAQQAALDAEAAVSAAGIAGGDTLVTPLGTTTAQTLKVIAAGLAPYTATGGTTPRSPADRATDVLNALEFGAKCDGTTDDTAAINAALVAAGAYVMTGTGVTGAAVTLPRGACLISGTLNMPAQTTLRGAGGNGWGSGTVITRAGTVGTAIQMNGANSSVEHLQVSFSGTVTSGTAIKSLGPANSIHDVFLSGVWDGITVEATTPGTGASANRIWNVYVSVIRNRGIVFNSTCATCLLNDHDLWGIVMDASAPHGLCVVLTGRVEAVNMSGSSLLNCGTAITLDSAMAYGNNQIPDYATFTGMTVDTCTGLDGCIYVVKGSQIHFNAMHVSTGGSSVPDIKIRQAEDVSVTASHVIASAGGIVLNNTFPGYPNGVLIVGNHILKNANTGISVEAGVSDFVIADNIFSNASPANAGTGNQTTAVSVAAGASDYYVITNNVVHGTTITDGGTGVHKTISGNQ